MLCFLSRGGLKHVSDWQEGTLHHFLSAENVKFCTLSFMKTKLQ